MHPDNCGGLGPIGHVGLRNEYALMLLGINVVLFLLIGYLYLDVSPPVVAFMVTIVIAYLTIGPFVFIAPLLPFRGAMEESKRELLIPVVQRIHNELNRLHAKLPSGPPSKEEAESIEWLRKVSGMIDQLPVWPFDAGTLGKFITAYLVPVVIPLIGAIYVAARQILHLIFLKGS
jgi:hypothetical protein